MPAALVEMLNGLELRERRRDPAFSIKQGEIFPGDTAAVLAPNRQLTPAAFAMTWGFRLERKLVFNARSESAMDKPMFRDSYRRRRCLIPASAYIEWDHRQKKPARYLFRPEESPMLYMCGLYRVEDDPRRPAFTILTRDASEELASIHDRMPVILPPDMAMDWLHPDADPGAIIRSALLRMTFTPAS